jgi:hypothetical protein
MVLNANQDFQKIATLPNKLYILNVSVQSKKKDCSVKQEQSFLSN